MTLCCTTATESLTQVALSMEADEGTAVELIKTRRHEELADAWDVVVHSEYVPMRFSALAAGISTGRHDAVSSLGSTKWSCVSGLWIPAGMKQTEATGVPPPSAPVIVGDLEGLVSSRISCMSGVWPLAGMNKTKPLREVTRTHLLRDFTQSGGRWRSC